MHMATIEYGNLHRNIISVPGNQPITFPKKIIGPPDRYPKTGLPVALPARFLGKTRQLNPRA